MPLSGGLLVPKGIHQPSTSILAPKNIILKTYNTYKEPYLDHELAD
jgi:hypothetical protein